MKTKRLSLAMAALAVALTSCFDTTTTDEIYYLYGVGTSNGTLVVLDSGLQVTGTSSSLTLSEGDRCYLYFTCSATAYETAAASVSNGNTGTLAIESLMQGGKLFPGVYGADSYENLEAYTCSPISDFEWLSYGGLGNGWLNFAVTSSYLYNTTTSVIVAPTSYLFLREWNASTKTLSLVVLYDNRQEEYDATAYSTLSAEVPVTFDVSELYDYLLSEGLSDEDSVNLKVYYVADKSHNLGPSFLTATTWGVNYCYVSSFQRCY